MAGLSDFLQSASNAAAGNISGPVDMLAWALRKAGVPINEPILGSDWMQRHGLTRPVEQSGASLAGETFGLLSPIGVAAKAPQIARGLLDMGANAATRPTLHPQAGAVVWHGSPHKFDAFDSSKIGTGEGAQAYGHGLYLAESPKVADEYARKLSGASVSFGGRDLSTIGGLSTAEMETAKWAENSVKRMQYGAQAEEAARIADYLARKEPELAKKLGALEVFDKGALYKVDLPDEQIAKMLDWDKPLSQQAPEVQAALLASNDPVIAAWKSNGSWEHATGEQAYRRLAGGLTIGAAKDGLPTGASGALKQAGIPGIRYLDGGSRGAGQGSSNYVIFPGNESLLSILERNGQPVRGLLGSQ